MKKLFVLGTGSQARYIIENNRIDGSFEEIVLVDLLSSDRVGTVVNDCEIKYYLDDFVDTYGNDSSIHVIIAMGDRDIKKDIIKTVITAPWQCVNSISQQAYIAEPVVCGKGVIINPHVTIMPNCSIGDFCIIHSGSVIEHDNTLGANVNIGPGVISAGNVTLKDNVVVYTGVNIAPKLTIEENITVGIGSSVISDLNDEGVYFGTPARLQK